MDRVPLSLLRTSSFSSRANSDPIKDRSKTVLPSSIKKKKKNNFRVFSCSFPSRLERNRQLFWYPNFFYGHFILISVAAHQIDIGFLDQDVWYRGEGGGKWNRLRNLKKKVKSNEIKSKIANGQEMPCASHHLMTRDGLLSSRKSWMFR